MVIIEHISGIIEVYDYSQSAWVELAALSDANVLRASARKQCCPDGAITIGGVYAAALSLVCRLPGARYFDVKRSRITVCSQYGAEESPEQIGVFFALDVQRSGEIFTISAQDAVGWTDTSSRCYDSDGERDKAVLGVGAFVKYDQNQHGNYQLQGEMGRIISIANRFAASRTGIPNLLSWKNYDADANGYYYANHMIQDNSDYNTNSMDVNNASLLHPAYFPIYAPGDDYTKLMGNGRTDSPRDMLRYLGELACGFIFADGDGSLTLGQFGQPEYGTATLSTEEIEAGSCEIADYTIKIKNALWKATLKSSWSSGWMWNSNPDYANSAYIRYAIDDNPYLDGFHNAWSGNYDTGHLIRAVWKHMDWYGGGYTIRPFRLKAHKMARYYLGQKIQISYKGYGETSETAYKSIITGVTWTFHGGWQLSCAGEDGRSMADCIRATKADKAIRNLQNDFDALHANYNLS